MSVEFITNSDLIGIAASYIYATSLLVIAELLRRLFGCPQSLTRNHPYRGGDVGLFFGVLLLFAHWQTGILPFATFIGLNYLYRYRIVGAMDTDNSSPGTIYFAVSVTLLFGLLWRPDGPVDRVPIAVAGIMAMTWGDAMAALIGRRFGQHRYQVWGSERSWEGSPAMFVASAVAMFLVLLLLPGSSLSLYSAPTGAGWALIGALLSATFATLTEAVSPHGINNLSVPLVAAGAVGVVMQGFY